MANPLMDIPVALLVGGKGTRLQSVLSSTPKPLASLGNGSFLELLVEQLKCQGFRRFVMCTGHLAEQIEDYFGDGTRWDVEIRYSTEKTALGTAGALGLAASHLRGSSDFLVLNGDSFLDMDFNRFLEHHRRCGGIATIAVRQVPDASRYGAVEMDSSHKLIRFAEKTTTEASGLINGGVYLMRREVLDFLTDQPCSLERDIFPRLLEHGIFGLEQSGVFIDIGIPEDYERAQRMSGELRAAARRNVDATNQIQC